MMNVFFCDIRGTFDSVNDRKKSLQEFTNTMLDIMSKLHINDLAFRFMTSDDMNFLIKYVNEVGPFFEETPIRLTSQFSSDQRYKNGQIFDIAYHNKVDQVKYISMGKDIERVFLADDSSINIEMISNVLSKICPNADIVAFNPNSREESHDNLYASSIKGIDGLINCMKDYSLSLDKTHSKKI